MHQSTAVAAGGADTTPDLSSRQLRAVLVLAEYRSFIAAATFLGISQPALTRTIQQVELALGVALFSRNTRQVEVTPAGREFAALAERLLDDMRIGVGSMRSHAAQQSGQIIVSSVFSLADAVLPGSIAAFRRRYPGIQLHLREGLQRAVVDDVRSGVADFGIGFLEGVPDNLIQEDLGDERFFLVLPSTHPLSQRKRIDIASLRDVSLVSFPRESRSRQITDGAAAAAGISLHYGMTVNRLPTLFGLVRNGAGLAIVPGSERPGPGDRRLTSRPLLGSRFTCRLGVMRSRERELTPPAATLLVIVRRWLRRLVTSRAG